MFGTAAAAPIGASTLLERTGSMAVTHGAARYRGYASPLAQPTEGRRLPQAGAGQGHDMTWDGLRRLTASGAKGAKQPKEGSDAAQISAELEEPHATNQNGAWFDLRLLLAFAKYM